ncbi:MAG: TATA-box-binding protein [Candidatus Parvarchaeota archaeon]|nr:TATA-box-binding protein [Candidatus Rehaiarchaeum fermentans]MCW1293262.1 TATA-box-binding protein [Candidatus Rehaiarchaeum fermentans]MCW1293503.1 TATA-box-binding protein [Candidatus Rehaiarchaeum fermentans]
MANYTVVNLVASITLDTKLPLSKMKTKLPNARYNPERFPGLVLKYEDIKPTFLAFGSGKLVCVGGKTRKDIDEAMVRLKKDLKKLGIDIGNNYDIKIQNIVVTSDLGRPVDLNRMAYELDDTQYNPEQFPGLVYRLELNEKDTVTFLIFGKGKIVCGGAKDEKQIEKGIDILINTLKEKNF